MRQADGLLNQVRFLVGSPLQWEVDSKFPIFGNGKVVEDHGNQYRVPSQVAEIYKILGNNSLSVEQRIQQLDSLVHKHPSKPSIQQLYNRIQQVIEGQSDHLPIPYSRPNFPRH
ncbi:MAG: hypothetical protein K0R66_144 [Gammaproteobacteria bacterium]|jgi:hypothetical protein|nr:hypothetical protein [Gammaproteobacteria bacterium]